MVLFSIFANTLLVLSIYFPTGALWYQQLLERLVAFVIYFVFIEKSRNTSPESRFNLQRLILIISALISLYITFEPLFSRRKMPESFTEYALTVSAIIVGTLLVRYRFIDQD